MNNLIRDKLLELEKYYRNSTEKNARFRANTYSKAAKIIRQLPFEIKAGKDIAHLPGIGKSIVEKIDEIIKTGQLNKINTLITANPKAKAIRDFNSVWGIGPVAAQKLYDKGFRTLDDLRTPAGQAALVHKQRIGLKYYQELKKRVPREVIDIYYVATCYVLDVHFGPDTYELEVVGSYRRGKPDSGDVDILITTTKFSLQQMVEVMKNCSNGTTLPQGCSLIIEQYGFGEVKFSGIGKCVLGNGMLFHLDITFVPREEWGSSLLHATGSDENNKAMRVVAISKGLKLSEHGLFLADGTKLPLYNEKDIYDALDLPYQKPHERN